VKTIFFDVDTQLDFLYPAGALPVPGAEQIIDSLGALTEFAVSHRIPILSTIDAHSEDDPEFKIYKPHCVIGTTGQKKAAATLLNRHEVLTSAPGAFDHVREAPQILVEKQKLDCFTNPNLRPLLDRLKPERYVVYGVATELCVRCAVFGLLSTGAEVELVTDGIKSLNAAAAPKMLERFETEGGRLVTVSAVTV